MKKKIKKEVNLKLNLKEVKAIFVGKCGSIIEIPAKGLERCTYLVGYCNKCKGVHDFQR